VSNGFPPFRLAHLSDLHATRPVPGAARDLLSKRALGWLSWRRRRRFEHCDFVLEALIDDLAASRTAHTAISGDLTHIGLTSEILEAAGWLARIGPPDRVSLVPGNHDAYAPSRDPDPWAPWREYMESADAGGLDVAPGRGADRFPFARRLGPVAVVGASSARPTGPLLATGRLGAEQLARLERVLEKLGGEGLFRVLLIHHPPIPAGQSRRRQLDDAPALREILARTGAELVLHGHTHKTKIGQLEGPGTAIPIVGVPSASSVGPKESRRARYHVYRIERDAERRFRVSYEVRGFDPATRRFAHEGEGTL
jgi:3',5'-cyclic AMP phosphodiesterase CpdA